MPLLADVVDRLLEHEDLYNRVSFLQVATFLEMITRFLPLLDLISPRRRQTLPTLPSNVSHILSLGTDLPPAEITNLWMAVGPMLLAGESMTVSPPDVDATLSIHAPSERLGVETIVPPVRECQTQQCSDYGKPLGGVDKGYVATLYTRSRGTIPVRIIPLYCRKCKTTYRTNYCVRDASSSDAQREYYGGVPDIIEVAEYSFVESRLVGLFRNQMAFSHGSGDTVARIYNLGLSDIPDSRPLSSETVWHAFYLHALLLHASRKDSRLIVRHAGHNADRLNDAIAARNKDMMGVGQPQWAHTCDDCEKIYGPDEDHPDAPWQRMNACVMDGVTVGHPRCNVSGCTNRLASPRDRFCPEHVGKNADCAVIGCPLAAQPGRRTCATPAHRELEDQKRQEGQALFVLKRRLHNRTLTSAMRALSSETPSSEAEVLDEVNASVDDNDLFDEVVLPSNSIGRSTSRIPGDGHSTAQNTADSGSTASNTGQSKLKAALGRRYTHNEQLMVRCCGVVISRATFYEAESMSNAYRFIVATFPPHFPRALPSFIFFDNNCNLLKHLMGLGEERLLQIGLPVDVFHALRKHKETDGFCQLNCNPAGYPELHNTLVGWLFNSSAAEQVNVWFGKFLPVVREMSELHFNFVLDEMILIKNEYTVSVLEKRGRHPRLVPLEELALPRE